MIALIVVVILLWLSWEMGHGADIRSREFWRAKRHGLVVGNPFRRLVVIFCMLSALVIFLTLDRAVGDRSPTLVGVLAGAFISIGGVGLWHSFKHRAQASRPPT